MTPQASLGQFAADAANLTAAEREVYDAIEKNGRSVRAYARRTDRAPGTVGNLLRRAREKVEGDHAE